MMFSSSSDDPEKATSLAKWHGWKPLGVALIGSAVLIAGFTLFGRDRSADDPKSEAALIKRTRPLPPMPVPFLQDEAVLHSVQVDEQEGGTQVYRIKAQENGDELTIDAKTGKLLVVRDRNGRIIPWSNFKTIPANGGDARTTGS